MNVIYCLLPTSWIEKLWQPQTHSHDLHKFLWNQGDLLFGQDREVIIVVPYLHLYICIPYLHPKVPVFWFFHPDVGWKGKRTHSQEERENNEYKLTLCSHFILHVLNLWNLAFLAWGCCDAHSPQMTEIYMEQPLRQTDVWRAH